MSLEEFVPVEKRQFRGLAGFFVDTLAEAVEAYFKREVLPHAADAWIDHEKTKVGYEIPFNRHFYVFEPPRSLSEIDADLKQVTGRILKMIEGLAA